jgi:Fe-S cluster assembly ATPase SufC
MTTPGIDLTNFRVIAQCINQLRNRTFLLSATVLSHKAQCINQLRNSKPLLTAFGFVISS